MNGTRLHRDFLTLFLAPFLAIAVLVGPAAAGTGTMPVNATTDSYGSGWECNSGFQERDSVCVTVPIPSDAIATKSSYGRGWECRRGYQGIRETCIAIAVPANAYLNASGDSWGCQRGFREAAEACIVIELPRNGFLTESTYGSGWKCERGYRPTETACLAVELPPNAHFDYSGNDWDCDRPFERQLDRCVLP